MYLEKYIKRLSIEFDQWKGSIRSVGSVIINRYIKMKVFNVKDLFIS
jgi:hypothetical protein